MFVGVALWVAPNKAGYGNGAQREVRLDFAKSPEVNLFHHRSKVIELGVSFDRRLVRQQMRLKDFVRPASWI